MYHRTVFLVQGGDLVGESTEEEVVCEGEAGGAPEDRTGDVGEWGEVDAVDGDAEEGDDEEEYGGEEEGSHCERCCVAGIARREFFSRLLR